MDGSCADRTCVGICRNVLFFRGVVKLECSARLPSDTSFTYDGKRDTMERKDYVKCKYPFVQKLSVSLFSTGACITLSRSFHS